MKDRVLNLGAYFLSLAGLFVAWMLSVSYVLAIQLPCGGSDGCTRVALSPAARLLGVPVAVFGVVFYAALACGCGLLPFRPRLCRALFPPALLGAAVSTGYTLYSLTELRAECVWCIANNAIVCALAFVLAFERGDRPIPPWRWRGAALAVPAVLTLAAMGIAAHQVLLNGERFPWNPTALARTPVADLIPADAVVVQGHTPGLSVVMFLDPACPACQVAFHRVLKLAQKYRLSLALRYMPLAAHPGSLGLSVLGEEAALQGKGLEFLREEMAEGLDTRIEGVQLLHSLGCAESERTLDEARNRVRRDQILANRLGLTLSPSIFLVSPYGAVEPATPDTLRDKLGHID